MLTLERDMLVGIKEIDNEHYELIRWLNLFINAVDPEAENKEIKDLFVYLEHYVLQHFATEERYMQQHYFSNRAS